MNDPKKHDRTERSSIPWVVASLWGVVLLLSVYGAPAVRDAVVKNETLAESEAVTGATTGVMRLADTVGFTRVRDGLGVLRSAINAPYIGLEEMFDEDPPDAGVADVADAGAADAGAGQEQVIDHYTASKKQRVLVVGASSIQFAIGTELERRIPTYEGVKVRRFGKLATGLARPDYFDWPKKVTALTRKFKPDLIIANFGGNGAQKLPIDKYTDIPYPSPQWDVEYGKRVKAIVDIGKKRGADVVFIGMPNMREKKFRTKMQYLNKVQKKAAEAAGAAWIPTWRMSSTASGAYRKTVRVNKRRGLMRTSDGVHYTKRGAKFVIEQVMQAIERRYVLVSPDKTRATSVRHGLDSKLLERRVEYVAFVPRSDPAQDVDARWPAVFLLPGGKANWGTWPNYPHRKLQALAQAHKVVLIVPEDLGAHWYVDGDAPHATQFVDELVADVTAHLPVNGKLSIAGQGAGGHAAIYLALSRPSVFEAAGSTGGWMDLAAAVDDARLTKQLGAHADNTDTWRAASPTHLDLTAAAGRITLRFAPSGDAKADATLAPMVAAATTAGIKSETVEGAARWSRSLASVVAWHAAHLTTPPAQHP